jgi:hypothetical protein
MSLTDLRRPLSGVSDEGGVYGDVTDLSNAKHAFFQILVSFFLRQPMTPRYGVLAARNTDAFRMISTR